MHAHTPPMDEARSLYVEQAQVRERVRLSGTADPAEAEPLVIWDVGLGAAANAIAAIHSYQEEADTGAVRPLRIVSFENDLDALRLACQHPKHFPYLRHGGPGGLLERGEWHSKKYPGLHWHLVEGDFQEGMARAPFSPDIIFFDLFSSRTNAEGWTLESFRRLYAVCRNRDVELFTYTSSTAARVTMLGAGFHLAKGRATDWQSETTIAFTPDAWAGGSARRHPILGAPWLARWKRSQARFPRDLLEPDYGAFEKLILNHPQFRGL